MKQMAVLTPDIVATDPSVCPPRGEKVWIEIVTPDRARELLAAEAFPRQRPLSPIKVDRMTAAIAEGRFPLTMLTRVVSDKGERWLVDGQHRLNAVIAADTPLRVVWVEEGVADLDAAGDYYARVDVGNSQRQAQDFLQAYGLDDHYGVGRQNATYFIRAIAVIEDGFRLWKASEPGWKAHLLRRTDPGRLMERFLPWLPAARDYAQILREPRQGRAGLLKRKGVAAVALLTLTDAKERAVPFWEAAAGEPIETDNPPGVLVAHLATMRRGPMKEARETLATAAVAAACWNAWWEERKITKFAGRWKETGLMIAGTRFAARGGKANDTE